jgi:hypothetical protein
MRASLDEQLAALATLSLAQLRVSWTGVCDGPVPRVSAGLLRLAIAHALQEKTHGGLSRHASQRLEQIASAKTRTSDAQPGMRLVREWQGRLHVVTIAEDGAVLWNEKHWRSLSEVAREITGTRWSGPAFFGLKQKRAAA